MRKLFVYLGLSLIATSLNSLSLSAKALVPQQSDATFAHRNYVAITADQKEVAKKTNELLIANGEFARAMSKSLGGDTTNGTPPDGDIFKQNLFLILQNQKIFRSIAEKVGATAAPAGAVEGADQSAKNHSILLTNKKICGQILKKLGFPLPKVELTGTPEEKNVTLLMANRAALEKIDAKLREMGKLK
jgi:hypothetical protein